MKDRTAKYLGTHVFEDWKFKIYSLKYDKSKITSGIENIVKTQLLNWIEEKTQINSFPNFKIGTVIIHQAKDSILTIVNWWVYENVIQNHVYFSNYTSPDWFEDYSNKGVQFCVWELKIVWHERNLWEDHVLKQADNPDWDAYINNHCELNFID